MYFSLLVVIMSTKSLFCLIALSMVLNFLPESQGKTPSVKRSNRPVIGILSQAVSDKLNAHFENKYHSYIAASYVKYVESAGARVVPIWIGRNDEYYEYMMARINGILFPGGAQSFEKNNKYVQAGKTIYRIAKRFNKKDDYFPIWGTCLGFELLTYLEANETEHRTRCDSNKRALSLNFTKDYNQSRMFGKAPKNVISILRSEKVAADFHHYCTTIQGLKSVSLQKKFRVMSLNRDTNDTEFISSLEHVKYPFYGVQFHPEKNLYEWARDRNIPHGFEAAEIAQYFANFFVNETRNNSHSFGSQTEVTERLIYNYSPTYTGVLGSNFQQCYLFTH